MIRFHLVLLALFLPIIAYATSSYDWHQYSNLGFGATADVPNGWKQAEPPDNGDGLKFTSPNSEATVAIWGSFELGDGINYEAMTTPDTGEKITYNINKPKLVVISGTKGSNTFYRKHMLTCDKKVWISFEIKYPTSRKNNYAPILEHIAHSLHQVKKCSDFY